MEKVKKAESFLKLIAEISKSGIEVDSNLVYSNLIIQDVKKVNINYYFKYWQRNFERTRNINVFVAENWKYFCQFKGYGSKTVSHNKIKIYVPLDFEHIYNGVNQIFTFLSDNNIPHISKVSSDTRFDDVVLRVDDIRSAELIREYIKDNSYIKEGLVSENPFAFSDGNISIVWDGNLSYNTVVSEWISEYINEAKVTGRLNYISYTDFYSFLQKKYSEIFINGKGISSLYKTRKYIDSQEEVLDYKYVTELLIMSLNPRYTLEDFYRMVGGINNPEKQIKERQNIKSLLAKDQGKSFEILSEQKEVFDYSYIEIAKKESAENAIARFKHFIENGDYAIFTREKNVRQLIMMAGITPEIMKEIIYQEQKNALVNASLETMKKYDSTHVGRALFGIRTDNYDYFTNTDNARRNLQLLVQPNEIDELIKTILEEEGYKEIDDDDSYWLFLELVKKMSEHKTK